MKHLFSESAIWQTTSEFVAPDGKISHAEGKSVIIISKTEITNKSWADVDGIRRVNNYKITPVSQSEFISESLNPELGKQTGMFNLDRSTLYSKFRIEDTSLNGYELIRREGNICYAQGALYENDILINTWRAKMTKVDHNAQVK